MGEWERWRKPIIPEKGAMATAVSVTRMAFCAASWRCVMDLCGKNPHGVMWLGEFDHGRCSGVDSGLGGDVSFVAADAGRVSRAVCNAGFNKGDVCAKACVDDESERG